MNRPRANLYTREVVPKVYYAFRKTNTKTIAPNNPVENERQKTLLPPGSKMVTSSSPANRYIHQNPDENKRVGWVGFCRGRRCTGAACQTPSDRCAPPPARSGSPPGYRAPAADWSNRSPDVPQPLTQRCLRRASDQSTASGVEKLANKHLLTVHIY